MLTHIRKKFEKRKRRLLQRFSKEYFIGRQAIRSDSDNGRYIAFVEQANNSYKIFSQFKQYPAYQEILEHVSEDDGTRYLEILKKNAPDFLVAIDKFKINDLVGNPTKFEYPCIGSISPTTLRYVKVASDLRTLFGNSIGSRVAEIGVGYGGQLLVLDQIFAIREYSLFDLPPVLELTSKYLESHILSLSYRTLTLNQASTNENYDFVMSNYAFSELPKAVQLKYLEKVLANASKGYMTMNSGLKDSAAVDGDNKLSLEELRDLLPPFEIIEEEPYTSPKNYIIIWGHRKKA
jgi:putative sugar O-methyltransferase